MIATETTTGLWEIGRDAYHADLGADSKTSLDLFRESDLEYHAIRIAKTMPPGKPTEAMLFGRKLHDFIMEPDYFVENYYPAPWKIDGRTKEGKAQKIEVAAAAGGKTIVDHDEQLALIGMREGIKRNAQARALLMEAAGRPELAVRWDDPATGLPLKSRFDRILDVGLVADLKGVEDPTPDAFRRSVFSFGWHRQAALYTDAARHALGMEVTFLFVAVGKSPPHEAIVYLLPDDDKRDWWPSLALGRRQNAETIRELARRKQENDWTGRYQNKVVTLS